MRIGRNIHSLVFLWQTTQKREKIINKKPVANMVIALTRHVSLVRRNPSVKRKKLNNWSNDIPLSSHTAEFLSKGNSLTIFILDFRDIVKKLITFRFLFLFDHLLTDRWSNKVRLNFIIKLIFSNPSKCWLHNRFPNIRKFYLINWIIIIIYNSS